MGAEGIGQVGAPRHRNSVAGADEHELIIYIPALARGLAPPLELRGDVGIGRGRCRHVLSHFQQRRCLRPNARPTRPQA